MSKVTVYYFKTYDGNTDQEVSSKRMATLEAIKRIGPGSVPILNTAKTIDLSEVVDNNGRYPINSS